MLLAYASSSGAGSLQLLALGHEWPDLSEGVQVDEFHDAVIADDGTIGVLAHLSGAGVNVGNDTALFVRWPGSSALVLAVREGTTTLAGTASGELVALGMAAEGVVFAAGNTADSRSRLWHVHADGSIASYGAFGGTSEPSFGDWALATPERFLTQTESRTLLLPMTAVPATISAGDPAPGLPGHVFERFQGLQVTADGVAGFHSWVTDGSPSIGALYTLNLATTDVSPVLRVSEGWVSRAGEVFTSVSFPTVLGDAVLFYGYSANANTRAPSVDGLWRVDDAGNIAPVVLSGQVLSEHGAVAWVSPNASVQAGVPDVALLRAGLVQGGTVANALLRYESTNGSVQPVLQEGDAVGGVEGLTLGPFDLGGLDYNEQGQIGFVRSLVDAAGDWAGIAALATRANELPQVLLRTGPIAVGPDCVPYEVVWIDAGGQYGLPGRPRGLSAGGEMWVVASLDSDADGIEDTDALFVASPDGDDASLGCLSPGENLFRDGFE